MALVTISGLPCSGKSTRSLQLQQLLEAEQALPVSIINDESLGLAKSEYDEARTEKRARAALLAGVQRTLRADRIVICDAMNYIKGYRYQLYCIARELGCRTCTIHVAAPPERCKEWNGGRVEGRTRYADKTMDELIVRYEEPSFATRWDTPLVIVPFSDSDLPKEAILDAVLRGTVKPPTFAAVKQPSSSTDYLRRVDTATSAIISSILSAQSFQPGWPATIRVNDKPVQLDGPANGGILTTPTLQRHKRAFVALAKQTGGSAELSEERIADHFVAYLQENLR